MRTQAPCRSASLVQPTPGRGDTAGHYTPAPMRELAPYAGVLAALGVALLLLARPVPARLAGIALFGVGVAGVGLYREP